MGAQRMIKRKQMRKVVIKQAKEDGLTMLEVINTAIDSGVKPTIRNIYKVIKGGE